ncbi:MAG: sec-independent protein translocase protein TatA [Solirubrobacteraceae bacterium]|jgi:sec-independent protein translocase protein TatA|nr:sec-independent protein translocase protein TatA [Solirubrobacteraceae bacterium]
MPVSVGPMELILVLAIALIVLGPKRLPEAGKALGKGLREFKDSVSGLGANDDDEEEGEPSKLPADRTAAPH